MCASRGLVPLYHYTSSYVSNYIFNGGFRVSTEGKGGVHFSTQGPAAYNFGSKDYEKNVIMDCFGEERLEECRKKKKTEVCFVYAAEPKTLRLAPGGRTNAKMIPKSYFDAFSREDFISNDFFLRSDMILTCFALDEDSLPVGVDDMKDDFLLEQERDNQIGKELEKLEIALDVESVDQSEAALKPKTMRYKLARTSSMDILEPENVLKRRVKLFGFEGKHEPLNGRKGEALSYQEDKKVYTVALDTSTFERGHSFFVKGCHLELMDPREDKAWRYAQSSKNTIMAPKIDRRASFKHMETQLMKKAERRSIISTQKSLTERDLAKNKKAVSKPANVAPLTLSARIMGRSSIMGGKSQKKIMEATIKREPERSKSLDRKRSSVADGRGPPVRKKSIIDFTGINKTDKKLLAAENQKKKKELAIQKDIEKSKRASTASVSAALVAAANEKIALEQQRERERELVEQARKAEFDKVAKLKNEAMLQRKKAKQERMSTVAGTKSRGSVMSMMTGSMLKASTTSKKENDTGKEKVVKVVDETWKKTAEEAKEVKKQAAQERSKARLQEREAAKLKSLERKKESMQRSAIVNLYNSFNNVFLKTQVFYYLSLVLFSNTLSLSLLS